VILRFAAFLLLLYALGFVGFAVTLPQPLGDVETDAVVVPTGGSGRIARGLEVVRAGKARQMFVSGVDPEVKPQEFADQFEVTGREMDCCVTLGFLAVDTRSNAGEVAQWVAENDIGSLRLVTTDWHMRRASGEIRGAIPESVVIYEDATPSSPDLQQLFLEYNKLLASSVSQGMPD
tara:strand:- start:8350 stop:8880 length:531 start_codon:yes stop_codon:yes gene_type:complete